MIGGFPHVITGWHSAALALALTLGHCFLEKVLSGGCHTKALDGNRPLSWHIYKAHPRSTKTRVHTAAVVSISDLRLLREYFTASPPREVT